MFELVNVSCEGLNSVLLTWVGGGGVEFKTGLAA